MQWEDELLPYLSETIKQEHKHSRTRSNCFIGTGDASSLAWDTGPRTSVTAFLIGISHIQIYILPSTHRDPYRSEHAQELTDFQTTSFSTSFFSFFVIPYLQHESLQSQPLPSSLLYHLLLSPPLRELSGAQGAGNKASYPPPTAIRRDFCIWKYADWFWGGRRDANNVKDQQRLFLQAEVWVV